MTDLIQYTVRRPVLASMVVVAGGVLGLLSALRLPVGLLPDLSAPGVTIITRWPGVAAGKIEEIVTIPIERQLSDIAGINRILSTSSDGESRINVIFQHDAPIKTRILDLSEKLYAISDGFPREVEEPSIVQYDPSNRPVYIVSFSSQTMDLKGLRQYVDSIVKLRFKKIEGTSEVFVSGGFEREIQVVADLARFQAHLMGIQPVAGEVAGANRYVPTGRIGDRLERGIFIDGKFKTPEEISETHFMFRDRLLRLWQLGKVEDTFRERDTIARTDGEDRVTLYVQKAGTASTLAITDECERLRLSLETSDVQIQTIYNQGRSISEAIQQAILSCIYGGIIAIAVLYLFLRRALMTFTIGLIIPASIAATLFLMFLTGIQINIMSLSGLALGAGMLVDNSVVVSESIETELSRQSSELAACVSGTGRVIIEIISATLTTLIIFLPLFFTDPETQKLYREFALTISFSLLTSLAFSLTVLPAFLLVALRRERDPGGSFARMEARLQVVRAWITENLQRTFIHRWMSAYLPDLAGVRKLHFSVNIRLLRNVRTTALGAIMALAAIPILGSMLRKDARAGADSREIEATLDLATGTHLDKTSEVVHRAEQLLRNHPSVQSVTSRVEKWHATLNIKIRDDISFDEEALIRDFSSQTAAVEEAFIHYQPLTESGGVRELDIDFYGDDRRILKDVAREAADRLDRLPGVDQVILRFREPRTEIVVKTDPVKSILSGATASEVGMTLRQFMSGTIVSKFYERDREIDIRLVGPQKSIGTPEALESVALPVKDNIVHLKSVATFSRGDEDTRIWRKDKRNIATITLVSAGESLDLIADAAESVLSRIALPPEVVFALSDEYLQLQRAQLQMLGAIILSILAVYLVLGALFESFIQPFIILLTIPVTLGGVVLFLFVFRIALSLNVYLGIMMLGGIVVNNSILVVSAINGALESKSGSSYLAGPILSASASRLRPVLMTTLTTVCGMLPMALNPSAGADLWRPFALTVVFGMSFAMLVSLALTPFVCFLYYRFRFNQETLQ